MEMFFELLPVGFLVFAILALVGHASGAANDGAAANDVDEDLELWLVSPALVPWLPDYSDD
jgi:hypothetical protein